MITDRISLSVVIKQENQKTASELLYLYKVCKDKEHFKRIMNKFIDMAEETANEYYELINNVEG